MMILQMPEAMQDPPPMNDGHFAYLMQFTDGNRIDLTLFPIARLHEFQRDSLSLLLLDKDGIVEPFPAPSESGYLPKPPTAKAFSDCCNEFWWVCPYVAKGLWREEIIYAKFMADQVVREQLMKMLTWYVGVKTRFSRSPGKLGKHFRQYLEPELWAMLEKSYADASYDKSWDALDTMCNLFRMTAIQVAEHFGFDYPHGDDEKVSAHLKHVRSLPKDATEMY
jgi:aminoglycoside 6-adenylyltransferase